MAPRPVSGFRFASLGSGSRGNGTVVDVAGTYLLVDCGFSRSETKRRLARLGIGPEQLTAVLVTHEHGDHIGGVAALARRFGLPVYASYGTAQSGQLGEVPDCRLFDSHEKFAVGAVEVAPFPVPHDAREPTQFVFGDGARRLGLLTDTGWITPHAVQQLSGCDALLLECNHEPELLARSHYPPSVKQRIGGRLGHLSNQQAAELLRKADCSRLQHIVAAHLSEKNNTPEHARRPLAAALNCTAQWIAVADQDHGLRWRQLV